MNRMLHSLMISMEFSCNNNFLYLSWEWYVSRQSFPRQSIYLHIFHSFINIINEWLIDTLDSFVLKDLKFIIVVHIKSKLNWIYQYFNKEPMKRRDMHLEIIRYLVTQEPRIEKPIKLIHYVDWVFFWRKKPLCKDKGMHITALRMKI